MLNRSRLSPHILGSLNGVPVVSADYAKALLDRVTVLERENRALKKSYMFESRARTSNKSSDS